MFKDQIEALAYRSAEIESEIDSMESIVKQKRYELKLVNKAIANLEKLEVTLHEPDTLLEQQLDES